MDEAKRTAKKISAKEAVVIASNYYSEISSEFRGVRVEEIELDEGGDFWLITLGIPDTAYTFAVESKYSFKEFKINAANGDVLYMKAKRL